MSLRTPRDWAVPARSEFLIGASFVARLADLTVALPVILLVAGQTGSYAWAGVATGALAFGAAVATPVLGRMTDRRGHRRVLGVAALVSAAFLVALALLTAGTSPIAYVVLAAGAGLASPPLEASVRSLIATREPAHRRQRLLQIDTTSEDLIFIAVPPVLVGLAAIFSPTASVLFCAMALAVGTMLILASPASAGSGMSERISGSPLREPAVVLLAVFGVLVGIFFGATELALVARAGEFGAPALAALLISAWAGGSFVGGVLAVLRPWRRQPGQRLLILASLMALASLPIAPASVAVVPLAFALAVQGFTVAPTIAASAELMAEVAPAASRTEAFAWSTSAMTLGVAAGHAGAGLVVEGPGAPAALLAGALCLSLAAVAAAVAVRSAGRAGRVRESAPAPVAVA
jgi:MFS family permease